MTIAEAVAASGLPRSEALILLAHALGTSRAGILARASDALDAGAAERFAAICDARRAGKPVAYLVGRRAFWTIDLEVSPAVLIPRPETELLVERALATIDRMARANDACRHGTIGSNGTIGPTGTIGPDGTIDPIGTIGPRRTARDASLRPITVADLGTGSGAIALAIATERPQAFVVATDASADALAVARRNASRLGVANVAFVRGSWLAAFADSSVDVIVANPPYVAAGDPHLGEGDLVHEPKCALTPGGDGLDAVRCIVGEAKRVLARGGALLVEHGFDQGSAVRTLCAGAALDVVETVRDLAGHERFTIARHPAVLAPRRRALRRPAGEPG